MGARGNVWIETVSEPRCAADRGRPSRRCTPGESTRRWFKKQKGGTRAIGTSRLHFHFHLLEPLVVGDVLRVRREVPLEQQPHRIPLHSQKRLHPQPQVAQLQPGDHQPAVRRSHQAPATTNPTIVFFSSDSIEISKAQIESHPSNFLKEWRAHLGSQGVEKIPSSAIKRKRG